MNQALCNTCQKLVDARVEQRDDKVFLVKDCPDCGTTATLISGDARRYFDKRELDAGCEGQVCKLNCTVCRHKQHPTLIFIDITNRCNLNCPICINNTPAMGYVFEPPLEYCQRIFDHFATYDPKPAIQLFGGEPTVHRELFEIIRMCKEAGLAPRVVTNGIKLADPDYCRRLVETRATILISYDGRNRALYRKVRNREEALDKKLQAIENLRTSGGAKVTFMTLVARGWNDAELPEIFGLAHECRNVVRAIYLMPLAHTWDDAAFDLAADRITTEDVENMVDDAFPDDRVDFMPASFLGSLQAMLACLGVKPLPFVGAHPNCESMYILLSDGERYLAWGRYLKTSTKECCLALQEVDRKLEKRMPPEGTKPGFWLRLRAMAMVLGVLRRHVHLSALAKGKGFFGKLYHFVAAAAGFALRRKSRRIFERHTNVQSVLQIIILPFEDNYNLETDRLERCPAAFAYVDPETDAVRYVPICSWGLHKDAVMRAIAARYAAEADNAAESPAPAPAGS